MFQKVIYLWIGRNCNPVFLSQVLGVPSSAAVPDNLVGKPPVASFTLLQLSFSLPFTPFLPATNDNENYLPHTVFAPGAGHCRVAENQSFHWLAEGSEAVLPLPICHQVGNRNECRAQRGTTMGNFKPPAWTELQLRLLFTLCTESFLCKRKNMQKLPVFS